MGLWTPEVKLPRAFGTPVGSNMISFSLALIYIGYAFAHFDGQVTSVMSHIDMEHTFLSFGPGPGQYTGFPGSSVANIESGHFESTSQDILTFNSVDLYPISAEYGDETHFQYRLDFAANVTSGVVASPLGSNGDPVYGCLLAGAAYQTDGFFFLLTNTRVYALVQQSYALWAIPIKNRISIEVNLYTIVINRNQLRVLFRIDNKTYLDAPGYCGIDERFAVGVSGGKSCTPSFTAENFMTAARNIFYLGPMFVFAAGLSGFCQGGLYNMCNDNISFAPSCRCQYASGFPGNVTLGYTANVRSIDIFTMGTTNRCDNESSSSSRHNWWSRPCKLDEETEEQA